MSTEDLVSRLRELLGQQQAARSAASALDPDGSVRVPVGNGSRAVKDLWQTAAAAVTSQASAMDLSDHFAALARESSAPVVSRNSTIGQAILDVLQGIRPRSDASQVFQARFILMPRVTHGNS